MTNEIRYRLADAVSIYDNGQGYLLIVLGQRGTICRLPYRQMTFDLLQFLESPADIQSIEIRFQLLRVLLFERLLTNLSVWTYCVSNTLSRDKLDACCSDAGLLEVIFIGTFQCLLWNILLWSIMMLSL